MWELSAPGGPAEGCFHRTTEYAFYYDGLGQYADDMPNVSHFGLKCSTWQQNNI